MGLLPSVTEDSNLARVCVWTGNDLAHPARGPFWGLGPALGCILLFFFLDFSLLDFRFSGPFWKLPFSLCALALSPVFREFQSSNKK
jgi:hypothetical protein